MSPQQPPTEGALGLVNWRRNAAVIAAGFVLSNIGWSASYSFLPLVVKDMGITDSLELWVGLISFAYFGTSCLTTPVWGVVADHFGRKTLIVRAGLGMGVGFMLTSLAGGPWQTMAIMVFVGLCNGYVPAGQALIATNTPRSRVGGVLALSQSAAWLGNTLGPVMGAVLARHLPRTGLIFAVSGACMVGAGLIALVLVREVHTRPAHRLRFSMRSDARRLWRVRGLKPLYYVNMTAAFTLVGANAVVSLLMVRMLEARPRFGGHDVGTWIAVAAVGFTVASIAVLPVWGVLLNRLEPGRLLRWQLAGGLASSLVLTLARDPLQLTVARVVMALFVSGLPPTLVTMIRSRAPGGMDSRTMSYGTSMSQLGNSIAPLTASALAPLFGLRSYFALCAALLLVGLVAWNRSVRR